MIWLLGNALPKKTKPFMDASCQVIIIIRVLLREEKHKFGFIIHLSVFKNMTSPSLYMGQVIRKWHSSSTLMGHIGRVLWLLSILGLSLLPSSIMRLWSDVQILVMATVFPVFWHPLGTFQISPLSWMI